MITIPMYETIFTDLNIKQGHLPFHIDVHTLYGFTPVHHHEFVELSVVIGGRGEETINGKTHALHAGIASLLLPHHMHEVRSDPENPIRKYCCMFDLNFLFGSSYDSEWCSLLYEIGTEYPSYYDFKHDDIHTISDIMNSLLIEHARPPLAGRSSMIRAKLTEALLLFIRSVSQNKPESETAKEPEMKQRFWPILQYIHVHYASRLSLESVAAHFHVSAPYISRVFKQYTSKSFLSYLHHLRIEAAANLLKSTNMMITDIAVETGFESLRTFSRVFYNLKRLTPSEFRSTYSKRNDFS